MRRFLKLLDKRLSLPIQWLTLFVEKETDKKRAEFWNSIGRTHHQSISHRSSPSLAALTFACARKVAPNSTS
jgi:hypothetical protein